MKKIKEKRRIRCAYFISLASHCLILGLWLPSRLAQVLPKNQTTAVIPGDSIQIIPRIERIASQTKLQNIPLKQNILTPKEQPITQPAEQIIADKKNEQNQQQENEESIKTISSEQEAVLRYQDAVKSKIQHSRRYPAWAKKQGYQGVVSLRFTIFSNGQSANIFIHRSSGFTILDQEAQATIIRAAPFPEFDRRMNRDSIAIVVDVVFQLN
jgi:protein TonB